MEYQDIQKCDKCNEEFGYGCVHQCRIIKYGECPNCHMMNITMESVAFAVYVGHQAGRCMPDYIKPFKNYRGEWSSPLPKSKQ